MRGSPPVAGSLLFSGCRCCCNPYDRRPLEVLEGGAGDAIRLGERAQAVTRAPYWTLQSVFLTLSLSLGFMGDAAAAAAVMPVAGEQVFDVEHFVAGDGTLYLIGADRARAAGWRR